MSEHTHIMTRDTPAILALIDAVGFSIVAAGATRPSEDMGKSSESEEQVRVFEHDGSHAVVLRERYRETMVKFKRGDRWDFCVGQMRKER